jgi:hypothetical protein
MTSDRGILASARGKREERAGLYLGTDPMRALVLACLAMLAGCIIDNDPVRVENFTADTSATFTYDAWTNTVMAANDDGAAEQIRRDWLAEALTAHGMCGAGYVIETRRLVQPWDGPFGNGGDVVYTGRCL